MKDRRPETFLSFSHLGQCSESRGCCIFLFEDTERGERSPELFRPEGGHLEMVSATILFSSGMSGTV